MTILSKRYSLISLLLPSQLREMLNVLKKAIDVTHQDYGIVIKGFIYIMI